MSKKVTNKKKRFLTCVIYKQTRIGYPIVDVLMAFFSSSDHTYLEILFFRFVTIIDFGLSFNL